jgi:hypothetical protein
MLKSFTLGRKYFSMIVRFFIVDSFWTKLRLRSSFHMRNFLQIECNIWWLMTILRHSFVFIYTFMVVFVTLCYLCQVNVTSNCCVIMHLLLIHLRFTITVFGLRFTFLWGLLNLTLLIFLFYLYPHLLKLFLSTLILILNLNVEVERIAYLLLYEFISGGL